MGVRSGYEVWSVQTDGRIETSTVGPLVRWFESETLDAVFLQE